MESKSLLPPWVEGLIVEALREFVPPTVIADAFDKFKTETFARLRSLAADTTNKIDDLIVAKVEEALNSCTPDAEGLCALITQGEAALIQMLRDVAAKSATIIDDVAVDILAEALL